MRQNLPPFPAMLGLLLLAACNAPVGFGIAEGVGMYETKPSDKAPADPDLQMAPHESWCYSTMGQNVECFSQPQDTPPGRLVNVDPPNRYPLTGKAYAEAVAQSQMPPAKPTIMPAGNFTPPILTPVQQMDMAPLQLTKPAPPPKLAMPPKPKKHKKKHKPKPKPATTNTATAPDPIPNPPGTNSTNGIEP